jgi:phage protein U
MIIGAFDGGLQFETSDSRILTYTGMQQTRSSRWQSHEIIAKGTKREYLGESTPSLSFAIHLSAAAGVSPQKEAEKWMQAAEAGRTGYLVIGGTVIGGRRWSVTKVTEIRLASLEDGRPISADLTVSMEGYK